jgi:serine/threonine protein kinase/WD40 repeat protein/tetratricopeptide (TPR) repeat protein
MESHPPTDLLKQLLADQLTGSALQAVAAHIQDCARCEQSLAHLAADSQASAWRKRLHDQHQETVDDNDTGLKLDVASAGGSPATLDLASLPARDAARPTPSIPDFEILGELGHGGMGVVYKARQVSLKRLVALKMILAGPQAHPQLLARFHQEAEAVARLQHPNIVQIFAISEHQGCPYLALEYVVGGSLDQHLRHQPQPGRSAAHLVEQLARAVHYAHQHGVVHRDLKPANILLTAASEPWLKPRGASSSPASDPRGSQSLTPRLATLEQAVPKISDFGLAKQLDTDSGQTQSGAILGTPSYMAPEQAEGKTQEVGPLVDVYALGAILYEMLTGQPPFRGATPVETIQQVLSRDVVPPSKRVSRVHRDLETICLKALAKEPRRRYESAQALADDLSRFLAGDAILGRRESLVRKVWRKARRNPVVLAAAAIVVLALGAAVYFGSTVRDDARQIATLTHDIEASLGAPELTAAYLERTEARIRALEALDESQAPPLRQRLYQRYGDAFRTELKSRTIRGDDVPRLEKMLAPLAARAPDLAKDLQAALKNRLGQWQPLVDLAPPFKNWDGVFSADAVELAKDKLLPRSTSRTNVETVFTRIPSEGNVRLDATFGEGWEKGSSVGVLLHASGQSSYQTLTQIRCSPDGRHVVTQAAWGKTQVWDLTTESVRLTFPATIFLCPAIFSPDGKYLVGGTNTVRFWDVNGFKEQHLLKDLPRDPTALAFDARGEFLAAGDNGGHIHVWDWARREKLHSVKAFPRAVRALRFMPDGKTLVSLGHEKMTLASDGFNLANTGHEASIKLWTVATMKDPRLLYQDKILPGGLEVSSDGQTLAIGYNYDHRIKLLDAASGKARSSGIRAFQYLGSMSFSPDGKSLAIAQNQEIVHCNARTGQAHSVWRNPRMANVQVVCYSADGRHLFAGDIEGRVYQWDTTAAKLMTVLGGHSYAFVLRGTSQQGAAEELIDTTPLETRRKLDKAFHVEIRRDGVLLRREVVEATQVPRGPLHLQVTREGRRLTCQINDLPSFTFEETMSYARDKSGVLALHWPVGAPLLRLRASQQLLPADTSPLEQGDALYVRGQFADALAFYQEQAILVAGVETSQECRHKQALCLAGMGREGEAAKLFEGLGREAGRRWPPLALCELWIMRLRQRQLKEAHAVFDTLRARFPLEELLPMLAGESRAAIMSAYADLGQSLNFYRIDPNRIRNLEHGAKVEKFLYGQEQTAIRLRLSRGYQAQGMIEPAFEVIQGLLAKPPRYSSLGSLMMEYGWLQRLRGKPQQALGEIDRLLFVEPGVYRMWAQRLLVERARTHAALQRWDAAEKDLRDFLKLAEHSEFMHLDAALMLGLIEERKGNVMEARRIWEKALLLPEESTPTYGFEFLYNLMLASLADKLTDADAEKFLAKVAHAVSGDDSMVKTVTSTLTVPPAVLRKMWRTPRGKELVRQIAFQEISFQHVLRKPPVLLITEWVKYGATGDHISADQDQLLWKTFDDFYGAYEAGKMPTGQVLPLALTWKGISGAFGWGGVEADLDPAIRGPFAYVFGHRYLRLKKEEQARRFFETARDHAGGNALLRRLAEEELKRLPAKKKN